jgi:hypothetical protein
VKKTLLILKNILIAFVLISIGFALGKHSVSKKSVSTEEINRSALAVRVYYMHASMRCTTCNTIEKMTKELLDNKYPEEIKADKVEFQEVNFQENEALAAKFDVVASCVVVARLENGKIVAFKKLDKVWTLFNDRNRFNAYINNVIQAYLLKNTEAK